MIPVFEWSDFRSPLYLKSYVCTVGIGQGNLFTREGALVLAELSIKLDVGKRKLIRVF